MSWTDERVETLKQLWKDGLSASQIANQLGGVSRNAVIGKVHRLGLEGRVKPNAPKATPAEQAPAAAPDEETPAAVETPAAAATTDSEPEAIVADNDAGATAPAAAAVEDDVVVPIPLKLKLTDLTERTCKWPVGDPMHDDFHFCGHEADEGRPYCEYHSGLAFQPASERRRAR